MRILNSEEIKKADLLTIERQGISSIELMERAAKGFANAFRNRFPNPGKGIVVCGPGNNGGDGLAIARLISKDLDVAIFLPDGFTSFSPDFEKNLKAIPSNFSVFKGDTLTLQKILPDFNWLADSLFGIGFNRPFSSEISNLIEVMNGFSGLKVSVDVPSGYSDSKESNDKIFAADWLGTFHAPKLKFMFPESQKYLSEFEVIDIQLTIPETDKPSIYYLQKEDVSKLLKYRPKFSHKGTHGHGLLIAGSEGKMGAAVLATGAILRSGIGLVSVLVPKIGRDVLQISHPAAMVIVDREKKELSSLPSLGPYQSIGIGPGIGKGKKTQVLVKELLERFVCPLVFDADAINIISENKDWLKLLPQNSILTPHPKEFERLVGKSKSDAEVFEKAIQFSKKFQVFLVLKSAHTLICFPNGNVYFNSTGNPGMAKGGSGDVLTGLITGLLAQGYSSGNACIIGAYIHGLAGDFAAMENGQIGMTVNQLIEKIPQAFMSIDFQSKLVISH